MQGRKAFENIINLLTGLKEKIEKAGQGGLTAQHAYAMKLLVRFLWWRWNSQPWYRDIADHMQAFRAI